MEAVDPLGGSPIRVFLGQLKNTDVQQEVGHSAGDSMPHVEGQLLTNPVSDSSVPTLHTHTLLQQNIGHAFYYSFLHNIIKKEDKLTSNTNH